MIQLNNIYTTIINNIKNFIEYNAQNYNFEHITTELAFLIKISITIQNFCLFFFIVLLIINIINNVFFINIKYLYKLTRYFNFLSIMIISGLIMLRFYITLKIESFWGTQFLDLKYEFYSRNNNLNIFEHHSVFTSAFGDAILLLSFTIGLLCLDILSSKNLFKTITNLNIFYLFNFFVTIMVSTNNLLIMFISFEFIFLPTMYFVYLLGYSKKIDKATEIFFYWTLFGSFLVLCNLSYIYYNFNTLNYIFLVKKNFSNYETILLFLGFLIGFGIKIPLAPFHHWLLKVHVEAPTAFSIFLSGFLVKSALYCLYMLISIFNTETHHVFLIMWTLYSLIVGTIGLACQTDIKKLIAWATVQEMSFILFFLLYKQMFLSHTFILFLILHGLMSAYMFFIVDILQRRFKTRSILYLKGLSKSYSKLSKYIWVLIFLFSGFPFTAKFLIEWSLMSAMLESHRAILLIIIFLLNVAGLIFFCKEFFTILYGIPEKNSDKTEFIEIQKKEYGILNYLISLIIILIMLMYFL